MKATSFSLVGLIMAILAISVANVSGQEESPQLTSTLVAWLSSQCEGIIEEMEAIAKQNSESTGFSVVNYLRYLNLYESLKVMVDKNNDQPIDELRWVRRKAKAFEKINKSAEDIVASYLSDLDKSLTEIESKEPKSKQVKVSDQWLNLYKTIRYIATHAPRTSGLVETATNMLQSSPDNSVDRKRSNRYLLATAAFS